MNNIPKAEEFLCTKGVNDGDMILSTTIDNVTKAMIEFAKLHVEAALEAAAETKVKGTFTSGMYLRFVDDKESILNAYPLDQIK